MYRSGKHWIHLQHRELHRKWLLVRIHQRRPRNLCQRWNGVTRTRSQVSQRYQIAVLILMKFQTVKLICTIERIYGHTMCRYLRFFSSSPCLVCIIHITYSFLFRLLWTVIYVCNRKTSHSLILPDCTLCTTAESSLIVAQMWFR